MVQYGVAQGTVKVVQGTPINFFFKLIKKNSKYYNKGFK